MSFSAASVLAEDAFFGPAMFALPAAAAGTPTECTASGVSPLEARTGVQPVGTAYHKLAFPAEDDSNQWEAAEAAEAEANAETELYELIQLAPLDDYYALLNLQSKNLAATEDEIRANFRKISLLCHPDKATPERRADAEARFKAMQKGFETLTNSQLRLEFDSEYGADDTIPGPKEGTADLESFLKVYGPVFARNAIYAVDKKAPLLGDENTSYEDLQKFYSYWNGFKSWREFARGDTEKCGDSASRDERRRAAQKNKKQREILKKEDNARIRKLVTQAQAIDQRLVAFKSSAVKGKVNDKQSAALARKAAAEEAKRKAEEAKKAEEEAKAAAKREADEARRKAADLSNKIKKFRVVFGREPELAGVENLINTMVKIMDLPEAITIDKAFRGAGLKLDNNGHGDEVAGKLMAIESIAALAERARASL